MATNSNDNDNDNNLYLPEELKREIILRLPAKSLIRFKLVSKDWYSLITSPTFSNTIYKFSVQKSKLLSAFNSILLIQGKSSVFSVNFSLKQSKNITANSTSYEYDAELIPLNHHYAFEAFQSIKPLASCDGLICIQVDYSNVVYVWNPYIHVGRRLCNLPADADSFVCGAGLGFVSSIHDYKIVYIMYRKDEWAVYVNALRTDNKWRMLDFSSAGIGCLDQCTDNSIETKKFEATVCLNEVLHWIIPDTRYKDSLAILKFDLVGEVFELVPSVVNQTRFLRAYESCLGVTKAKKLCVYQLWGKRFSIYNGKDPISLSVWMLEEYGMWDSWVNVCSIKLELEVQHPRPALLTPTDGGKVLIQEGKIGVTLVDPCRNPPLYVPVIIPGCLIQTLAINYVESHVSPFC